MRHRLVGLSTRGLLLFLLSFTSAWAQSVSTAQIAQLALKHTF
jgi:hypothetical protein